MTTKCRGRGRIAAMETTSMKFSCFTKQSLHRPDRIPTGLTHPMAAYELAELASMSVSGQRNVER